MVIHAEGFEFAMDIIENDALLCRLRRRGESIWRKEMMSIPGSMPIMEVRYVLVHWAKEVLGKNA